MFTIVSSQRLRELESAKEVLGETLYALSFLLLLEHEVARQEESQKRDAGKKFYGACGQELPNRQDAPRLKEMLAKFRAQVFGGVTFGRPDDIDKQGMIDRARESAAEAIKLGKELDWEICPGLH